MAYEKQTWTAGDAITKQRMDHIEDGIAAAAVAEDINNELARKINQSVIVNNLDAASGGSNTGFVLDAYQGKVLKGMIDAVSLEVSADSQQIAQGAAAYQAIVTATTAADPTPYSSLVARFDAIDSTIDSAIDNLKKTLGTIVDPDTNVASPAYSTTNTVYKAIQNLEAIAQEVRTARINGAPGGGEIYDSLYAHLTAINTKLSDLRANVTSIESAAGVNTETGEPYTLTYRINQLQSIANEIEAAHRTTTDTLSLRFGAIEQAASDLASTVSTLDTTVVKKTDVKDDFTSNDTNLPLSALKGKELRQMIGGSFDATNTVAKAIINAQNTAQSNATDYADDNKVDKTNIYNALDYIPAQDATDDKVLDARQGKALKDLIDSMDTAYKAADTALDGRVSDIEDAIDTLNGDASTEGSVLNTVNTQIAAVVAEAPEAFDTLKEIADWIDNHSTDALEMQQNISDNADAISALQDTVGDENSGLVATANAALTKANAAAVKTEVDSSLNGLDARLDAIDGGETLTGAKTLATRVGEAESAITILQNEPKSATEIVAELPQTGDATKDYLVGPNEDGKYFYYKWINNAWNLISGGGSGEGNTSGYVGTLEDYNALEEKDENTDYYVLESDGYHHYRWIGDTEIEIGVPESKKYNINIETVESDDGAVNYLSIYEFNYDEDNTIDDATNLDNIVNKRLRRILLPATGGGGGTTNTMKVIQVPSRNIYKAANSNTSTYLRFFFTTGEENEPASYTLTIDGTSILDAPVNIISGNPDNKAYTWPVDENGEELSTEQAAALGFYSIDITNYCNTIGTHTATVTVALDSNAQITAPATWNINTFNLSLTSNFTNNAIVNTGSTVNFNYIPTGNVEKIVHFKLDGTEIDTVPLAARVNTTQTYTIPAQSEPGAHKLEVYLTANSGMVKSASIFRDIIWQAAGDSTIILASPYRNNQETLTQYSTIDIPYTIAGGNGNYNVSYYVDDFENSVNEITLTNNNTGTWSYRADIVGNHTLRIKCEESYIDIRLVVTELQNVDIAPVTANLVLDFNPSGITNTSAKRLWSNDNYNLTVSDNFDWYNGGYGSDANGDYFLVKAGTRATFDYYMFNKYTKTGDNGATSDASVVYRDGAELKIIFKTDAVRSADAVWFSNMGASSDSTSAKEVGIQLNVHNGWLKTDAAGESTKSYLYFPYSEEDKIELDININKETEPNSVYCMSYEDGCPSRAYPYTNVEVLYQSDAKPIVIGSDDCDVYIYRMRIYDSSLTTEEVLRNFIADGKDVNESIDRYNRNCIYYDTQAEVYTPYEGPDTVLDPIRLAQKLPDVKILMLDTPHFTTSKKDFIPYSTLRCIHAKGGTVYPSRGKEDNWFFGNGYHSGQGTTSDKYGNAGRNVDFLFNCDGIHNPSDKVKPDKGFIEGYQSYVIKGYGTEEEEEPEYCTDWKGDSGKVSLTSTSVPNNFFNLKVNIASSENVNNALFQKRYNDYLPYLSPAYLRDNRIKNDMEFVPAILFVRENDDEHTTTTTGDYTVVNYTNHTEFNDKEWHFYALGNIGDSKKTDYTRAYDPDDMNEFTLEISDNNTNNSQFQSGVYMKNGERTIEAYTLEQDMDDGEIVEGSFTANSSESDITIETTDYLYPIDRETEWEVLDEEGKPKNMRYWSLMNEGFDGDHSFEMRYACKGDYRDGKVVNDTTGKAKAQLALNTKVWQEFYTWLVTSSDEQFVNELDQWVVRSSVAYFYAFTHYYTMIDNRAKNTFWHFAKTGKHRIVSRPSASLLHLYEEADGEVTEKATEPGVWEGTFKLTEDTAIVSGKIYYTQYAFDMWSYDMDTAAGIDNNGELIFPYGKEDTDYRIDGDPASGPVFNGAGSIFWARLRKNCNSDITTAFTGVNTECFNANNLITQFDRFQSCYPEAIWRLDVERKYIRPFTGDKGIKDSNPYQEIDLTRKETRFLGDMMQGRKKYQRRQWVKNQAAYFGSKYFLPIISDNNQFDMVCYTIGGQEVLPNWDLTITPYQDLYIRVDYGETPKNPVRAKAGQPVEITCPFNSMNESRIRIYGADYIQALAGKPIKNEQGEIIGANSLASLYFRGNSFSNTHKLRKLIIGSENSSYNNSQFTTLNLSSDSPILEELDIQNCSGLTGALDLSGATALKTVKAQGTALTSISLPSSTNIENLYLPTTISTLMLIAAKRLKNISFTDKNGDSSIANLTSLILNDSDYSNAINWINIAREALAHLTNLQLINLNYASITDIANLAPFANRKDELGTMQNDAGETISRINLTGLIHITGNWSEIERDNYMTVWPRLTFDTSAGTKQTKYKVTYKFDAYEDNDGNIVNGDIIKEIYVNDGATAPDIYSDGTLSEMPHRDPTVRVSYEFGSIDALSDAYIPYSGWQLSGSTTSLYEAGGAPIIRQNTVIETHFETISRTYYVKWFMNEDSASLVKTSVAPVAYGEGYDLEAPTVAEIHAAGQTTCSVNIQNGQATYSIFNGWEKLPTNITPSANDETYNIYATYDTGTVVIDDLFNTNNLDNLTPVQLLVLSTLDVDGRKPYDIASKIAVGKRVTYTMGQDSIVEGTTLVSGNPLRLDSAIDASYATNIQPLKAGNDAFTLAIDYCFNPNATYSSNASFAVLASVYYGSTTEGIRNGLSLFYGLNSSIYGLRVGWGDMYSQAGQSKIVGNTTNMGQRNIIVLRHPKGSNTLYIYSGLNGNINTPEDVEVQTLEWSNYNSNAYLNFGRLTSETTDSTDDIPNTVVNGKGTIFWSKYWPEDLGVGECKRLAAWPHETITYAISQLKNSSTSTTRVSPTVTVSPSIYLSALTASSHIKIAQAKMQGITNFSARDYSEARTLCNKRIFFGLPTSIQAIMCQPNISYTQVIYTYDQNSGQQGYTLNDTSALIGKDYVFQYSAGNLTNKVSAYIQREDGNFSWLNNNVIAYTYSSSGGWTQNSSDTNSYYMNIRSPFKALTWSGSNKMRVFREYSTQIPSNVQIASSIASTGEIRSGDIYIDTYNQAYIYVLNSEIQALGIQIMPTTGDYAKFNTSSLDPSLRGGWVRAEDYWTRSAIAGSNAENFAYVNEYGEVETTATNGASATGLNVMYTFAI